MQGEGRIEKEPLTAARLSAIAGIVLACDQISKSIALRFLTAGLSEPVIKDIFHLTLVFNRGAAFGMLRGRNLLFIIMGIAAALFIIAYLNRLKRDSSVLKIGCALILGGIIGNIIDRLRYGCVVDFLDFRIWPVFNVADTCITIGAALILVHIIKFKSEARNPKSETSTKSEFSNE